MLAGVNTTADACNGTAIGDMTGCITLIQRGNCLFTDKVAKVQAAGAAAAIIWNNVPGILGVLSGKHVVQGAGCRVRGAGCRVQGAGRRVEGAGFRVWGAGCRVQGLGCGESPQPVLP